MYSLLSDIHYVKAMFQCDKSRLEGQETWQRVSWMSPVPGGKSTMR